MEFIIREQARLRKLSEIARDQGIKGTCWDPLAVIWVVTQPPKIMAAAWENIVEHRSLVFNSLRDRIQVENPVPGKRLFDPQASLRITSVQQCDSNLRPLATSAVSIARHVYLWTTEIPWGH